MYRREIGVGGGDMVFMSIPRISITAAAYRGLKAEADLQDRNESDLLSELIMNYISKRAKGEISNR